MTAGGLPQRPPATLATRLRTTPPRAKQPPDAPMTCPRARTGARAVRLREGRAGGEVRRRRHVARAPNRRVPAGAGQRDLGPPLVALERARRRRVSSLTMHPVALPPAAGVPVVPAVAPAAHGPGRHHTSTPAPSRSTTPRTPMRRTTRPHCPGWGRADPGPRRRARGSQGLRVRQLRLGGQPGRPLGLQRLAGAAAVLNAQPGRWPRLVARRHRDLHLRRRHHHRASAPAAAHHADHADPDAGRSDARDTDRDTDHDTDHDLPEAVRPQRAQGLGEAWAGPSCPGSRRPPMPPR